ncbi:DUF805 domain-containing protein [Deinococcus aquiradiocola]|uniref:DUF805 domain-containing protein n=1 Tax=Deinococcus aquiradiocola TaxID=393059 RepID=A0A917UTS7_9DEIO|nr:DUF805 domain-containing protein [Deinococcus aquiradiocola]GGJ84684.1 DUF805 domain-containing protein [Deinococcus aquiradiocola]
MNEYLNVIRNNYANFSGRARRREFWMFTLVNFIITAVLYGLFAVTSGVLSSGSASSMSPVGMLFVGLLSIYGLATLIPTIAVTVRRLHDAGFSGWWYLLTLIGLSIVILVFTVLDSKPGSNKWGPNPKGLNEAPKPAF